MKKTLMGLLGLAAVVASGCASGGAGEEEVIPVASFRGLQVTGITMAGDGRMFVNFPRWRQGVPFSVAEVMADGGLKAYPDREANEWEIGREISDGQFVCVQSVVAHGGRLYVLDTKNPLMKGIVAAPEIYVYDLGTDELERTYELSASAKKDSYVNDLRVDDRNRKIYLTDSGVPGLIVLDIVTGDNYRVLDGSLMTSAETDHLIIGRVKYTGKTHSDGIALDVQNQVLYFHALSGHTLYGVPVARLLNREIVEREIFRMETPATDGMIIDPDNNLIMGDLENGEIVYLPADRLELRTLAAGENISWPDTFAIHDGYLYFTNSRIHEAKGDISDMEFTVCKVRLPGR